MERSAIRDHHTEASGAPVADFADPRVKPEDHPGYRMKRLRSPFAASGATFSFT
jgi:hypothetical protein